MEMEDFYKDINQLKRSLRTLRKYHEEAEGCSDKGLHLAACILWGICVEAALLSCALTEINEIKKENLWPRDEEGKEKDVKDWGLNDLLTIAQKKWFKDRVSTKEIERIRKLQNSRNIVTHPAAYLFKREKGEFPSKISKPQENTAKRVYDLLYDYMKSRLLEAIGKKAIEK